LEGHKTRLALELEERIKNCKPIPFAGPDEAALAAAEE
jgi:hypothetical protein